MDDSSHERLQAAISIAETLKSPAAISFLAFALENFHGGASLGSDARYLAYDMQKATWLMSRPDGRTWLRQLLDATLEHAKDANSFEWTLLLMSLKEDDLWSAKDRASLNSSFQTYREERVGDERRNLETVGDAESMKQHLENLQAASGHDFSAEIAKIEERMIELEDEEPESSDEGTAFSRTESRQVDDEIDDGALRGMFATLVAHGIN